MWLAYINLIFKLILASLIKKIQTKKLGLLIII